MNGTKNIMRLPAGYFACKMPISCMKCPVPESRFCPEAIRQGVGSNYCKAVLFDHYQNHGERNHVKYGWITFSPKKHINPHYGKPVDDFAAKPHVPLNKRDDEEIRQ